MSYPQQPGYPPAPPQNHPRATTALVLGILSLVVCGLLGPFAWRIGKNAMNDIDASGGQIGGRGLAQAGYICGLIATILLIAVIALVVVLGVAGGLAGLAGA
ncbi:MAG: DUF4190 domain-containing protein [Propionibacteriales bacterium]|nr:DUF4190 domain-containing protein [Propionibacteriales bacterium]